MRHNHGSAAQGLARSDQRRLLIVLGVTSVYFITELAGGYLTGSLALLSDAVHLLTDIAALCLALLTLWISTRPASSAKTYGYLRAEIDRRLSRQVEVITPSAPEQSGCQLSLRLLRDAAAAKRCHERLGEAGMVVDWREPDVIRIAPTPLYNSYCDVPAAVAMLATALEQ